MVELFCGGGIVLVTVVLFWGSLDAVTKWRIRHLIKASSYPAGVPLTYCRPVQYLGAPAPEYPSQNYNATRLPRCYLR